MSRTDGFPAFQGYGEQILNRRYWLFGSELRSEAFARCVCAKVAMTSFRGCVAICELLGEGSSRGSASDPQNGRGASVLTAWLFFGILR